MLCSFLLPRYPFLSHHQLNQCLGPGIDLIDGGLEKGIAAARNYTTNDYHKPSDEVRDDWDWSGIEQDLGIFTNFIDDLANSGEYPNWYEGNEFKALRDASRE